MNDYLRRLACEPGLEEALETARVPDDFEMRVRTESEDLVQDEDVEESADVTSTLLVGFGTE